MQMTWDEKLELLRRVNRKDRARLLSVLSEHEGDRASLRRKLRDCQRER